MQFIRQWRQAGLAGTIPLITGSTVDGLTLPALREDAVGVAHFAPWGPDFDNPQSKKFVASYEAAYNAVPGTYANEAERLIGKINERLAYDSIEEIFDGGLHNFLTELQHTCRHIGEEISRAYFHYAVVA